MKAGNNKKRVFVGMSGGVDSSVSAALLKKQGFDVTGVFIRVWQPDWIGCNWKEERLEAMRAAAHLDIPFSTLDLETEYKKGVIDYMIREYQEGRTPNPDVMCNREVKFGAFWQWAEAQGADFIATGHYAQNINGRMMTSRDLAKDQTYFLWTLTHADLEHILFPIGGMTKDEVRTVARKMRLPNAEKKDSQGLCFMGKVDVKEFLKHYIQTEPGKVLNEKGEEIGHHPGALLFTIGERHGFTITRKTPVDSAYYVISKKTADNVIVVSQRNMETGTAQTRCKISNVSWVNEAPTISESVEVRTRYREKLQPAVIEAISSDTAAVVFTATQNTLTPGQSLVMYKSGACLGGGIIV